MSAPHALPNGKYSEIYLNRKKYALVLGVKPLLIKILNSVTIGEKRAFKNNDLI